MGDGHDPFEQPERSEGSGENDAKFDAGREPGGETFLERDNNDPLDLEPDDPEWSDTPATRTATAIPGPGNRRGDPAADNAATTTNNQTGKD